MPKERFYTSDVRPGEEDSRSYTVLSWSREAEYVQMCTAVSTDRGRVLMKDAESGEWKDTQAIENAGFYVQLNRYTINQMIRTLRRARDQAFGQDA